MVRSAVSPAYRLHRAARSPVLPAGGHAADRLRLLGAFERVEQILRDIYRAHDLRLANGFFDVVLAHRDVVAEVERDIGHLRDALDLGLGHPARHPERDVLALMHLGPARSARTGCPERKVCGRRAVDDGLLARATGMAELDLGRG